VNSLVLLSASSALWICDQTRHYVSVTHCFNTFNIKLLTQAC